MKGTESTIRYRWVNTISFECQQCGECCSHLGLVHIIYKDLGDDRFIVNNQYTGEKTSVTIDPDKHELFRDRSIFTERPEACPFFRFDPVAAKGYCTVHLTRPEICRDYGCWRMLILGGNGKRAGRIMCERHLASEDPALTRLFEEQINTVIEDDTALWDAMVIRCLTKAGYTVRT
ncbi:MAG: YkgJ family cysteine cluster protein [Methanoregula sp.]|nr:YkgJ family cysteine cluster protein [Methanoregula sp.]